MSRSRSTRAHQKVIDAALKLFAAEGIDATSMDAIAATSGVSKATIYKHWRDKEALCLEVLASLHGLNEPVTKTGDHRADMVAVLKQQPEARRDDVCARLMPHLAAYAARNPAFNKAWRSSMLAPARIQLTQLLKRAIDDGSMPAGLNLDFSVALLMGPMIYGHVMKSMDRKLPDDMAERVVDAFWRAHSPLAAGGEAKVRQGVNQGPRPNAGRHSGNSYRLISSASRGSPRRPS